MGGSGSKSSNRRQAIVVLSSPPVASAPSRSPNLQSSPTQLNNQPSAPSRSPNLQSSSTQLNNQPSTSTNHPSARPPLPPPPVIPNRKSSFHQSFKVSKQPESALKKESTTSVTHPTTVRELNEKVSKLTSESLKSREQYNELNRQNHELQDAKLLLIAKNDSLMDQEKLLAAENDILKKKVGVLEKEMETLKKENKSYQEMFSGFELDPSSNKTIKGDECCLCLEGPIRFAINKCGHVILCENCGDRWSERLLKDCPLCRKPVESVLKLYL